MKSRSLILIILSIVNLVSALPVAAEYNIKTYKEIKTDEKIHYYIMGVGNGYVWANAELDRRKMPLLYCQNITLPLTGMNYIEILSKEVDSNKYLLSDSIEYVLLKGLRNKFPCESN